MLPEISAAKLTISADKTRATITHFDLVGVNAAAAAAAAAVAAAAPAPAPGALVPSSSADPHAKVGPPQWFGSSGTTVTGEQSMATQVNPGFLVIGRPGSYILGGTYGRTSNPCNYAYGTGGVLGYQGNPRSTTGSSLDGHGNENIVTGETQVNCGR